MRIKEFLGFKRGRGLAGDGRRDALSIRKFPKIQEVPQPEPTQRQLPMAQRATIRTTYEVGRTLKPIYTGGSLALAEDGHILAASLGEDVLLTDLTTGKELGRVEGDDEAVTVLTCEYSGYMTIFVAHV